MKKKKRLVLISTLALAFTVFITTAFAELSSNSGYDQLKDSIKKSGEKISENKATYTLVIEMTLRDGNEILLKSSTTQKQDGKNDKHEYESIFSCKGFEEDYNYSYYNDREESISSDDKTLYRVMKFDKTDIANDDGEEEIEPRNPFESDRYNDGVKLVDAFVGNLSKQVFFEEGSNNKVIKGSLNEAQIPAYINSGIAYIYKNYLNHELAMSIRNESGEIDYNKINDQIIVLKDNIFIKNISGKVDLANDKTINKLVVNAQIEGRNKNKQNKTLTFEGIMMLKDIDSTVINRPDLANKKVEQVDGNIDNDKERYRFTAKDIGKWKTDMIIIKDGKYIRTGEKVFEITEVTDSQLKGNVSITYNDDQSKNISVPFILNKDKNGPEYKGEIVANDKKYTVNASIHDKRLTIYNNGIVHVFSDEYVRVFEN